MKALFFGTPEVAVPFLELLAKRTDVVAVVSQPDKPAGRGLSIEPTPVKKKALELGFKVLQPAKPSDIASPDTTDSSPGRQGQPQAPKKQLIHKPIAPAPAPAPAKK